MKHLLTTITLLMNLSLFGQQQAFHLGRDYGVTYENADKQVGAAMNAALARLKYPYLWEWGKAQAQPWSDDELLALNAFESAWADVIWRGQAGSYTGHGVYGSIPGHSWTIEAPACRAGISFPLPVSSGRYMGAQVNFSWTFGGHNFGGTELYVDHERWNSERSADRIILRTVNWGQNDGHQAWQHYLEISHFMFNGMRRTPWLTASTEESAGVGLWDPGETSLVQRCYFVNFEKDGLLVVRGTPASIAYCSFFTNNRFGLCLMGVNATVIRPSGDENGVGFIGSIAGYNRPATTHLTVIGAKVETGTGGEFRPWKGAPFLYLEGWATATVQGVTYAATNITPYCLIMVDQLDLPHWSTVKVEGLQWFGNIPPVLVYDRATDREWLTDGNAWESRHSDLYWSREGLKSEWVTTQSRVRAGPKGVYRHLGEDGATAWGAIFDAHGGKGRE